MATARDIVRSVPGEPGTVSTVRCDSGCGNTVVATPVELLPKCCMLFSAAICPYIGAVRRGILAKEYGMKPDKGHYYWTFPELYPVMAKNQGAIPPNGDFPYCFRRDGDIALQECLTLLFMSA